MNPNRANTSTGLQFYTSVAVPSTQITGSGSIQLNGINFETAYLYDGNTIPGGGGTITLGTNHLIHGRGDVEFHDNAAVFVNNGTISGDVNGSLLRLYFSLQAGNKNNGMLKATNGGTLYFDRGVLDQTGGGTIFADTGSLVQLGSSSRTVTINGGTFTSAGTGVVEAIDVFVNGCTNSGAMELLPGDRLYVQTNGLTNNGTITINPTAANTSTGLEFPLTTQLNGTGSVVLNGINFQDSYLYSGNANSGSGVPVTFGANQLIHGRGDIIFNNGGAVLINNGTINADAASAGSLRNLSHRPRGQ